MSDSIAIPQFRTGSDEAEKAAARAVFGRVQFFSAKPNVPVAIRFLTEHTEWRTCDQHGNVGTKPKPEGVTGEWPSKMSASCRRDKILRPIFADCFICMNGGEGAKISTRTWAVVAERELVFDGPKLVGVKDKMREVQEVDADNKPTGVTREEVDIKVVNLGWKNFFGPMKGMAGVYGTLLDRDYVITRKGDGLDTDYNIVPLDPIPGLDLRNPTPEVAARYAHTINLDEMIFERASDEYFAKFFDTRVKWEPKRREAAPAAGTPAGAPVEQQQARPSGDADAQAMADIQARLLGRNTEAAAAPAEAPVAAAGGLQNFS